MYYDIHVKAEFCFIIGRVREDMDEPTGKLMGAHGYCTQVNHLYLSKSYVYFYLHAHEQSKYM